MVRRCGNPEPGEPGVAHFVTRHERYRGSWRQAQLVAVELQVVALDLGIHVTVRGIQKPPWKDRTLYGSLQALRPHFAERHFEAGVRQVRGQHVGLLDLEKGDAARHTRFTQVELCTELGL